MNGKIKEASRLVDSRNDINGVHELSNDIRSKLEAKHPPSQDAKLEALLPMLNNEVVESVIFEEIAAESIVKTA